MRGEGEREIKLTFSLLIPLGSSQMDQRRFSLVADSKDSDKEAEEKPSNVIVEKGFYKIVGNEQAPASNERGSEVQKEGEGQGEEFKCGTGSLTTPHVKLPLISNTAIIANSSSD